MWAVLPVVCCCLALASAQVFVVRQAANGNAVLQTLAVNGSVAVTSSLSWNFEFPLVEVRVGPAHP
jgi:hypothetical protein